MQEEKHSDCTTTEQSTEALAAGKCNPLTAAASWRPASQVLIDFEMPHLVLSTALDRADDEAIWKSHAAAHDPEICADWLAGLSGTVTRTLTHPKDPSRVTQWHCSLIAAPYVSSGGATSPTHVTETDRTLGAAIWSEWRSWIAGSQEIAVIAQPVAYTDICHWSPVTQREFLAALYKQAVTNPAARLASIARIPAGFPQLHFVVGSVSRWLAFPELPDPQVATHNQWQLRSRMAGYLGCHTGCEVNPVDVQAPRLFPEAVMQGLRMWLQDLARRELVGAWHAQPAGKDIVVVEMTPVAGESQPLVLPLRSHQLGRGGIELLLLELQQLFGVSRSSRGRPTN